MADPNPFDLAATLTALLTSVPDLEDHVEDALDLSELVRQKALPNRPVATFVVPAGLRPRSEGDAGAGTFTQAIDEYFAIVLVLRAAGDVTGKKLRPKLNVLVWQIIAAVCGRDDGEDGAAIGVFRLVRSQTLSLTAGVAIVQIDVAIQLQLRND